MVKKMKIGILGSAHLHVHSYIKSLKDENIEITGIYDRQEKQAEEVANQYNLPYFLTVKSLLETDCDTILICSENVFHKELAIEAMRNKKHVIVEKPMALTVSDGNEMIRVANEQKVKLMVAHPVRFSKVAEDMKKIIEKKELGRLMGINASNHGKNPGSWFIEPSLSGGGALIDHTVHICDLVFYFFGLEPKRVMAYKEKSDESLSVEDIGLMTVEFQDNIFMNLDTSWNRPTIYPVWGDAVMEMIFEDGFLVMDGFGRKMKVFSDRTQKVENFYYENDMDSNMLRAMVEAIDNDLPEPVSSEAGLYTVKITEAAFKSATEGRKIQI